MKNIGKLKHLFIPLVIAVLSVPWVPGVQTGGDENLYNALFITYIICLIAYIIGWAAGQIELEDDQKIAVDKNPETEFGRLKEPTTTPTEDVLAPKYGESNKIFTKEMKDAADKILREKLGGLKSGVPLDPQIFVDFVEVAGYHIEAGLRSFVAYSKKDDRRIWAIS